MDRLTLGEVRDGSGDNRGGLGRVGAHRKVRDGSGDPQGGLGRVGGTSRRSGTGQATHPGPLGGSADPSRTSRGVSLSVPTSGRVP